MDKFVTVKKPSSLRATEKEDNNKDRQKFRYNPYGVNKSKERKFEDWKDNKRTEKILAPLLKPKDGQTKASSSALTKHLLNTLGDESNPITNSDIYHRSDHISSAATGHQRSEGRGPGQPYIKARYRKLANQLPESSTQVLQGVRIYINGYLETTTDIEMKRIVTLAGGQVMHTASGATHILTSQQLNGSKTQKLLTAKSKHIVHVVRPEWVMDSIDAGRRLSEREYSVVKDTSAMKITDMFGAGSSKRT
ncbi:hypothetical protein L226DRAFT_519191 [Lentinus tigrinus ALCF2SS1-7]|uniref:BRCT domain-containing protein n=1 Tax=Lentinus tigrinus ALCF2SS1-6 TaxID=1328759 RepID=A0A5C2SUH6_9APHY|nr:hypothetical protein L227DRAFT_648382 [Lentinus tigrinus ALCF2SS1-6]RPD81240.1 hypothetical protein L226DRAFT_519191 [Lentinus tigrinus ALCF2SS1-7]